MKLPMLRFVNISSVLLLFGVVLTPRPVAAGEFALDPFKGTCTELLQYAKEYQQQHMTKDESKATGGDLEKGMMGYTAPEWRYGYEYESGPPRRMGNEVCLKPTKLKNVKFWAEPQMRRIEWKHGWPEKSQCAAEWRRAVQHVEAHEQTHREHARKIAREIETAFSQQAQQVLSQQGKDFPDACGSTKSEAEVKMKSLLESQLVEPAIKNAQISFDEASIKFHASDKIEIDCSKCKSYSFEGLNIHYKVKWLYDNNMEVIAPGEMILESEGRICGNPLETDRGYVLWGVDNRRPNKARVPWSRYRELQSDPTKAKAEMFGFPRFLSTNPPQFEWIVPSDSVSRNIPQNAEIRDAQLIPATPTARVPAIVSEEPLGCEESQTEGKPVSSVPQMTKWFTRFSPLPTTRLLRCE